MVEQHDFIRATAAIAEAAERFGITSEECRRNMEEAIDAAWEDTCDPEI